MILQLLSWFNFKWIYRLKWEATEKKTRRKISNEIILIKTDLFVLWFAIKTKANANQVVDDLSSSFESMRDKQTIDKSRIDFERESRKKEKKNICGNDIVNQKDEEGRKNKRSKITHRSKQEWKKKTRENREIERRLK